jgi:DNA-binding NtrC family response regulator
MAGTDGPSFHGIIGRSAPMQDLYRQIALVARTDAIVLIRGERGTGKELVATAIQELSRRRGADFVRVNCAALPGELLASELFGHERGAFTGAQERRPGLFVAADGGTLFADEIGNLSIAGQAMLLRAIELGEVRPLGAKSVKRVDVRFIAATNKDLERAIVEGEFLPDLRDRLVEIVLEVPPLRARSEDIPLLVEHFVALHCRRHGVEIRGVSRDAWRLLQSHDWPGNVRELRNAVSRAVIFAAGAWIQPQHLGLPWVGPGAAGGGPTLAAGRDTRGGGHGLSWSQEEALRIAAQRGEVRRRDVMARCAVSRELAWRDLGVLVERGWLERFGSGRGVRYVLRSYGERESVESRPGSARSTSSEGR